MLQNLENWIFTKSEADSHINRHTDKVTEIPSRNQVKTIIIKFLYHHQKDLLWRNRKELMRHDKTKHVYIVDRLAERDRDVVNYAKDHQLLVTTNNCQPSVKIGESWVQVNSKNDVDKVTGIAYWNMRKVQGDRVIFCSDSAK